jgi:ribosomal protein S19E (S16A)
VLGEFSAEEIEGIYPALSPIMVRVLIEELELMGYVEIDDGKVVVTARGEAKLDGFKGCLSKEERDALGI